MTESDTGVGRALVERSSMPAQERFSILLVDDDPMIVRVLNLILREFTPIRFANSGREALRLARESVPDLVLLDVSMPEMSGLEVCEAFKLDPALAQVPIIFVTSYENAELQAKALELGVADFVRKPPQGPVVLARVRAFQRIKTLSDTLSDTLQSAATMDFLTGAVTRRQLEKSLKQEWRRALRSAAPLALLIADIDGFGAYNAEVGNDKGDACLKSVADALRLVAHRPADVLGRYAGGRFAVLLPETDAKGARTVAQGAIDAVDVLHIPLAGSMGNGHITLSVGGACGDFSRASTGPIDARISAGSTLASAIADDLLATAERALDSVKSAGGRQARLDHIADSQTLKRHVRRACVLNVGQST